MANFLKILTILPVFSATSLVSISGYINYDEFTLKSDTYENKKWIYVDSSGDTATGEEFSNEYGSNHNHAGNWEPYTYATTLLTIDTTKYAGNSSDFQKKYKSFTINYDVRYNLWDSKTGWDKNGGKTSPFSQYSKNDNIIYGGNYINLFENYSNTHKAKVKIDLNFKINNDLLLVGIKYTGVVWWKSGSIYNHAGIVSSWHEKMVFSEKMVS
ncbi:hypothetical protein SSYRP_v1c07830 [Spiroplasma syrphidicola EA-1]|uniref:Uncharacterized protein n=1 Tax=Spiroplasma syrphidicola EA-1 TaxID=1276229 RepID=R4U6W5_9MOLU|nr:hypothetical protein [Spiroplasma syrphidicola]AGM26373.1 hypothetical protein SSYRP_v1c07830 [Spiroplasma syrphidicola EA-1]